MLYPHGLPQPSISSAQSPRSRGMTVVALVILVAATLQPRPIAAQVQAMPASVAGTPRSQTNTTVYAPNDSTNADEEFARRYSSPNSAFPQPRITGARPVYPETQASYTSGFGTAGLGTPGTGFGTQGASFDSPSGSTPAYPVTPATQGYGENAWGGTAMPAAYAPASASGYGMSSGAERSSGQGTAARASSASGVPSSSGATEYDPIDYSQTSANPSGMPPIIPDGSGQHATGVNSSGADSVLFGGPIVSAPATCYGPTCGPRQCWSWQQVPDGLMFPSYLAGPREPRLGSQWYQDQSGEWYWDSALGGRVGLLRYGTQDSAWPEGYQLDVEGAAFPRLTLDEYRDLVAADFRFGFPLTHRQGPWETKFGYYHISSHIGDEYLEKHPGYTRINYVRESLVLAVAWRPNPDWRLYAEAGYAVYTAGGAEPWEFQFGAEYSPARPTGFWGDPFIAVNGHLREENDFGGNVTAQAGLQWRGHSGDLFRLGAHYFNGLSSQYQFYNDFEQQVGVGVWYDY